MGIFGAHCFPKKGGGREGNVPTPLDTVSGISKETLRCLQQTPKTAPASPVTNAVISTLLRSYRELCAGLGCSALQLLQRSSVPEAEVIRSKYLTNTPRKGEWKGILSREVKPRHFCDLRGKKRSLPRARAIGQYGVWDACPKHLQIMFQGQPKEPLPTCQGDSLQHQGLGLQVFLGGTQGPSQVWVGGGLPNQESVREPSLPHDKKTSLHLGSN